MRVALVGNQNCGKTTLFNCLTGSSQRVGNFPGVTVDSKIGTIRGVKEKIEVVDLPGIYSLSPYSNEEIVTRDFILHNDVDLILNIIDATNIERNLYLTLQLMELGKPMLLAVNMMDEVRKAGNSIDQNKLEDELGIELCSISAAKGEGIGELIEHIKKIGASGELPKKQDICPTDSPVHQAIHAMMHLLSDHSSRYHLPIRYLASRIVEGDALLEDEAQLSDNEKDMVGHIVKEMEKDCGLDREAAVISMRYEYIDKVCADCVKRVSELTESQRKSQAIDKVLTNKWAAFPIFILIMGLVFYLTFGLIGKYLSDWLEMGITALVDLTEGAMESVSINPVVVSLVCDGVMGGIGSVLSFLPTVVTLFFFLSLLEDSGYMARIAFIMDKPLRKLGLSGRSFVPMLIGFGCSVPAVMASRTLTSDRDKKLTIFLIPFMSCSAKLPVFTLLTAAFFGVYSPLVMIGLYLLGIAVAVLSSAASKALVKGKPSPFMMELPTYRLPGVKTTLRLMWDKAVDFIKKAFTVIFVATVIVWFLQSFDYRLNFVTDNEQSLLSYIGRFLTPVFYPFGVTDWRLSSAILTGLTAKESIVSTLDLLLSGESIQSVMNGLQAFAVLVFVLLYMPCVATFAAMRKELGKTWMAVLYMFLQTLIAYLLATLIYQLGNLFLSPSWLHSLILSIVRVLFACAAIYLLLRGGCWNKECEGCALASSCHKVKNGAGRKKK